MRLIILAITAFVTWRIIRKLTDNPMLFILSIMFILLVGVQYV